MLRTLCGDDDRYVSTYFEKFGPQTYFVTLQGDLEGNDELVAEIRAHVAKKIGRLARSKRIVWADDLPKTRSGKIMRRLLRDIAEGHELGGADCRCEMAASPRAACRPCP